MRDTPPLAPRRTEGVALDTANRSSRQLWGTRCSGTLRSQEFRGGALWRTTNWTNCLQYSPENAQLSITTSLRLMAMRAPTTLLRITERLTNCTQTTGTCEAAERTGDSAAKIAPILGAAE